MFDAALLGIFKNGTLEGIAAIVLAAGMILSLSSLLFNYAWGKLSVHQDVLLAVSVGCVIVYFYSGRNLLFAVIGIFCLLLVYVRSWLGRTAGEITA